MSQSQRPIGVFDSGLGGLTLVHEIRKKLPNESIVYFGDLARLPYGIKSKDQIKRFSLQNARLLKKHKVKAIVVACNSSSSAAYRSLKKQLSLPVIDVIEPACEAAARATKKCKVGVIATQATVESGAYVKAIQKQNRRIQVYSQACPLFVPFVEEGRLKGAVVESVIREYLRPLLKKKIDVLVLGCTHYPMLRAAIKRVVGKKVQLVDSIEPTVKRMQQIVEQKRGKGRGKLQVLLSDQPRNFRKLGEKFLGEKLKNIKVVKI